MPKLKQVEEMLKVHYGIVVVWEDNYTSKTNVNNNLFNYIKQIAETLWNEHNIDVNTVDFISLSKDKAKCEALLFCDKGLIEINYDNNIETFLSEYHFSFYESKEPIESVSIIEEVEDLQGDLFKGMHFGEYLNPIDSDNIDCFEKEFVWEVENSFEEITQF